MTCFSFFFLLSPRYPHCICMAMHTFSLTYKCVFGLYFFPLPLAYNYILLWFFDPFAQCVFYCNGFPPAFMTSLQCHNLLLYSARPIDECEKNRVSINIVIGFGLCIFFFVRNAAHKNNNK